MQATVSEQQFNPGNVQKGDCFYIGEHSTALIFERHTMLRVSFSYIQLYLPFLYPATVAGPLRPCNTAPVGGRRGAVKPDHELRPTWGHYT